MANSPRTRVPIVELKDIHKSYAGLEVLRGITLTAHESEVVALIGSSGSGKSTLLRCINMLEVPDRGTVSVAGETIALTGEPPHRRIADEAQIHRIRAELGMVFQQFNLWSHMTVIENVMEAHNLGLPRRKALIRRWRNKRGTQKKAARLGGNRAASLSCVSWGTLWGNSRFLGNG